MKTECKNASAGSARPDSTRLEAVDQTQAALDEVVAVLNLLCNDHIDGRPFSGIENTDQALKLVGTLLGVVWGTNNDFGPFRGVESGQFNALIDRLWALILLLENNADNTPNERVLVALTLALRLAESAFGAFDQCLEGKGKAGSAITVGGCHD